MVYLFEEVLGQGDDSINNKDRVKKQQKQQQQRRVINDTNSVNNTKGNNSNNNNTNIKMFKLPIVISQ